MANYVKQYYDIKYPLTNNNEDGFFVDLNETINDKLTSEMLHVVMTQKGERLRMPDFGTNLIKYIFNPSDAGTWSDVESDIRENVTKYVPDVTINRIRVLKNTDGDEYASLDDHTILVDINYNVKKGKSIENNNVTVKI